MPCGNCGRRAARLTSAADSAPSKDLVERSYATRNGPQVRQDPQAREDCLLEPTEVYNEAENLVRRLVLLLVLLVVSGACRGAASSPTVASSPAAMTMDDLVGVWMSRSAKSTSATSEPCNQLSLTVGPAGWAMPRLTLSGSCGATSFTALGSGP